MTAKSKICGIFLGGQAFNKPSLKERLARLDYIIAADSGCDMVLGLGKTPNLLLGDMDSISAKALAYCNEHDVEILTYPSAKNFTDGEMALTEAVDRGYENLEIYAAYGDRIDHTMANIFTALPYARKGMQVSFINEDFTAYLTNGNLTINGGKGDLVSLIALGEIVSGITLKGFVYELNNEDLSAGSARGVSNILDDVHGEISHKSGNLLVIHYPQKEGNI